MRGTAAVALATLLALPSFAAAQSLAELAARERERKKGQKPTGKVITEDELRRAGSGSGTANTSPSEPAAPGASPSPGAAAKDGKDKPKTEDELRAEQEQAWRQRLNKARADLQRTTQTLEAVNRSLADTTGNLYSAQRTNLLSEAERLKGEQQSGQAQVAALEDEGRRSRFRP